MYREIFQSVRSTYVAFDVLQGSLGKIIDSTPLFKYWQKIGLTSRVIKIQESSYSVLTNSGEEQFERVVIVARSVQMAINLYLFYLYLLSKRQYILPLLVIFVAIFIMQFLRLHW